MQQVYSRLLSAPVKLQWAGWETDTYRLQSAGWSMNVRQDFERNSMRMVLEHKAAQMHAITHHVDWSYMDAMDMGRAPRQLMLPVHMMARDVHIHEQGEIDWTTYKPIDATPQFVTHRISRLQDLVHFAPAQVRTKELFIPQESVEQLMGRILELQQPERIARIREEIRNPEGRTLNSIDELHDAQKFEAQIISFRNVA